MSELCIAAAQIDLSVILDDPLVNCTDSLTRMDVVFLHFQ